MWVMQQKHIKPFHNLNMEDENCCNAVYNSFMLVHNFILQTFKW